MDILRSFFLVLAAAVPLTVMSYNIRCGSCERPDDVNHWSRRKFLVSDLIRKSRADVIGLQEAELFQVRDLVSLLDGFDWVGVGRDDGAEKGGMQALGEGVPIVLTGDFNARPDFVYGQQDRLRVCQPWPGCPVAQGGHGCG